jgi:undecaprenyl-diphosphatase
MHNSGPAFQSDSQRDRLTDGGVNDSQRLWAGGPLGWIRLDPQHADCYLSGSSTSSASSREKAEAMEYLQVMFLAVVQGIGEFLPISSSGHLVLGKTWLQSLGAMPEQSGKTLEVLLHVGTLGSILVVYWHDLLRAARSPRMILALVVATIPAAVVGLSLEDWFDRAFNSPQTVGFGLLVTALMLWIGQTFERAKWDDELPWLVIVLVGCFQAVALVPGISRSGSTIAGGLLLGMSRLHATRFSFLLAVPVTLGAITLTCLRMLQGKSDAALTIGWGPAVVGMVTAFVVGLASLKLLLRLVSQRRLHWFSLYCALVGLTVLTNSVLFPPAATPETPQVRAGTIRPTDERHSGSSLAQSSLMQPHIRSHAAATFTPQ